VRAYDWQLVGQIDHQRDGEQWRVRAAKLKAKDKATAWIMHLARNAAGAPVTTRVVAMDEEFRLSTVDDAKELLDVLVQGYCALRQAPLPYFLEAACAYRKALGKDDTRASAQEKAEDAYKADGSFMGPRGDICDPYVALLWRGRKPVRECWEPFTMLADAFWTRFEEVSPL
jgi:exodeoxyribonuclease V gamma subunit